MGTFLLHHRHEPQECRIAFAAWRGVESPLRHNGTHGTCALGGHELWWLLDAESEAAALAQLPEFLAARTRVVEVADTPIP